MLINYIYIQNYTHTFQHLKQLWNRFKLFEFQRPKQNILKETLFTGTASSSTLLSNC